MSAASRDMIRMLDDRNWRLLVFYASASTDIIWYDGLQMQRAGCYSTDNHGQLVGQYDMNYPWQAS